MFGVGTLARVLHEIRDDVAARTGVAVEIARDGMHLDIPVSSRRAVCG